jgi:hypothetical protein
MTLPAVCMVRNDGTVCRQNSVADPGSGSFLTPRSGILDGYKIRIRIRDEQAGFYSMVLNT